MSIANAIMSLSEEHGISETLIRKTVQEFMLTAYEQTYHTRENAVVRFNEADNEPTLYARKVIVETVEDPVTELALDEALRIDSNSEIDDEMLVQIDPKLFDRNAINRARQRAKECLNDIQKDVLYSEYSDRVGEIVIGYITNERDGDIYVNLGATEGVLPHRYQSPGEAYRNGDRIKAIVFEVNKVDTYSVQIVLSRTHTEFVQKIFELEVPEIQDKTVEIYNIVREPGVRTKIAVYSSRDDVDAVGACVGPRGARIQAIVKELEGEKIDLLNYSSDVVQFITSALSPAQIERVEIVDEEHNTALAVVAREQLATAIGRHGINVRLASKMVEWTLDVKTQQQIEQGDGADETAHSGGSVFYDGNAVDISSVTHVSELPHITTALVFKLQDNKIENINDLFQMSDKEFETLRGFTADDLRELETVMNEYSEQLNSAQRDDE